MPHSAVGYPSYIDLLTAKDLSTLFEQQGGRCPISHRLFFLPPEDDLPPAHADLLLSLAKLVVPANSKSVSMEPQQEWKLKYVDELDRMPWPVRVDMDGSFQMGNLMLIARFMVDVYQDIGGLAGLRKMLAELPDELELQKITGTEHGEQ